MPRILSYRKKRTARFKPEIFWLGSTYRILGGVLKEGRAGKILPPFLMGMEASTEFLTAKKSCSTIFGPWVNLWNFLSLFRPRDFTKGFFKFSPAFISAKLPSGFNEPLGLLF